MSTNIYEGQETTVTRFACGQCRKDGPCFQVSCRQGPQDYIVIHRAEAHDAAYAILHDMHKPKPKYEDPCVDDEHRGTECKCCHMIEHCCSHHCCCFYRCSCRHSKEHHPEGGACDFGDCDCQKYKGE